MNGTWMDAVEDLGARLRELIEPALPDDDTKALVSEAVDEFAVVVEQLQARNTELVANRADLEQERERYKRQHFIEPVLDTVAALVIVVTPEGRIQRFNSACEDATGLTVDDVIGRDIVATLVPVKERDRIRQRFQALGPEDFPMSFETDWINTTGVRRTVAWTCTGLTSADGSLESLVGTGIDVTDSRLLERRLAQADRLESVGRLAAGIAHDFSNTLSTIQLVLDRMRRRAGQDADLADIDTASETIDRTKHIIADLHSFSRLQTLHPAEVDLDDEISRTMALLGDLLGRDVSIKLETTSAETIVSVDPGRFEQALTNLIINARDAMPDGGTITLSTDIVDFTAGGVADLPVELEPGRYVRLVVSDTGTGIEPDIVPHVFDPYFTTKPASQGTGLGLATTFGTVSQAGGAIMVDSRPGVGSAFTIHLPQSSRSDRSFAPPATTDGVDRALALVVEDHRDVRVQVAEELERVGYDVIQAGSGTEAIAHLEAPVDVLVTDLQLPGVNGADVAAALRSCRPELAVVFITGAAPATQRRLLAGDVEVVMKPFTSEELATAINSAVRAVHDTKAPPDPS